MASKRKTKLVIGGGYLGMRVARLWRGTGAEVMILTRSVEKAERMAREGFQPIVADLTCPKSLIHIPTAHTILHSVGFQRKEGQESSAHWQGVKNFLATLSKKTGKLIYASTTGLYTSPFDPNSPLDGPWVDENSPTLIDESNPKTACPPQSNSHAMAVAERLIGHHALATRAVILRIAGLYGPGRIPHQYRLQEGMPLAVPGKGWMNLIRVDDAAAAIVASEGWASRPMGPQIVCLSDGDPVIRGDYYRVGARLLKLAAPNFIPPAPDSPAAIRAASSKRISNAKLVEEFGFQLTYPSFREGLKAILQSSDSSEATLDQY